MKEARFLPIDDVVCRWPLLRFEALAHEVESLDDAEAHATVMGRKIATLVSALEKVEQFEQVISRVFFVVSCCVCSTFVMGRSGKTSVRPSEGRAPLDANHQRRFLVTSILPFDAPTSTTTTTTTTTTRSLAATGRHEHADQGLPRQHARVPPADGR